MKPEHRDRSLAVVVMAAGKGTRMKSDLPKVLHSLNCRPMLSYVIDVARSLSPLRLIVIVGFQKHLVMDAVRSDDIIFVSQDNPQGTGHAVLQTESALKDFSGDVLILSGDVPLLPGSVLEEFITFHRKSSAWMTLMTADLEDPTGYGRVVRDSKGFVTAIIEEKDASDHIRQIKEFNSGLYLIRSDGLFERLHRIKNNNVKSEYYLTDILGIAVDDKLPVAAFRVNDANLVLGVNTIKELSEAESVLEMRTRGQQN